MKKLRDKARAIIRSTSGESLMEGIISILVFTVLIASITMMLLLSLRITGAATNAADVRQREANAVLRGFDPDNSVAVTTFPDNPLTLQSGSDVVQIQVDVYSTGNFTAFAPVGGAS